MDDLFQDRTFDIIKIDVQGCEIDIIKGGKRIFQSATRVYMEVPVDGIEYNLGAPKRREYFQIMEDLGFKKHAFIENLAGVHEDFVFEK